MNDCVDSLERTGRQQIGIAIEKSEASRIIQELLREEPEIRVHDGLFTGLPAAAKGKQPEPVAAVADNESERNGGMTRLDLQRRRPAA